MTIVLVSGLVEFFIVIDYALLRLFCFSLVWEEKLFSFVLDEMRVLSFIRGGGGSFFWVVTEGNSGAIIVATDTVHIKAY